MLIFLTSVNEAYENDAVGLEELLVQISADDKDALSKLYSLTKASVYGFALSILKNPHDAEDVMQNVYVNIWNNSSLYRASGKPMAWILTVTKNLCYMRLRQCKKTDELDSIEEAKFVSFDNTSANAENRLMLEAALKILNNDERQIVMLHAVSGLKFREIASLLDMVTATVLSKYHRAILKMKKLLEG